MPVAAVTLAGRSSVSSGSANTARARSADENTMRFTPLDSSEMTAERPTSLPVPLVVGSATSQGSGRSIGRTRGWSQAYSRIDPSCTARSATAFATSSAAPPPKPITQSARCSRKAATPRSTCPGTGLPCTPEYTPASRPPSDATKSERIGSARKPRSVTRSGRFSPRARRLGPARRRAPAPKWISVGNENCAISTATSHELEVALQFPVGDGVQPAPPFPLARGGEVVDEIGAEPLARELRGVEDARRLDERARRTHHALAALVVAGDRPGRELHSPLHAFEPGGERGGDGEVRVHVGTGTARLQARRLGRAGQHAERGGAVVHAPGGLHRRPEAVDQALVRIDGGPEHRSEFHEVGDLAGEVALEGLRHAAVAALGIEEEVLLAVGEALVDVPRASGILRVPL